MLIQYDAQRGNDMLPLSASAVTARLAFEGLHLTWIGVGPCARKLHPLAAARASRVIAVLSHWNIPITEGPKGP
jgi:hypothetical protein